MKIVICHGAELLQVVKAQGNWIQFIERGRTNAEWRVGITCPQLRQLQLFTLAPEVDRVRLLDGCQCSAD